MRLEDMLKDVSGITQKVVDSNCFQGANTLLENILLIQTKVNEVIKAINDGVIKGDKGDKGDKGETGSKGDKGDTGKATESIQDNVTSLDTTWSSTKIDSCFNDIKNIQGVKYGNDVGYQVCKGTHNGIVKDLKIYGKSLVNGWRISEWMKVNTQIVATDKVGTSVMQIMQKDNIFNVGDVITVVADISVDNSTNCYWQVNYMSTTGEEKSLKNIPFSSGVKTFTIQLPSDFSHMRCIFVGVQVGNTRTFKNNGCMCIKGDLKGYIPSYFEGIASVGNGNKIEVLSCNKNLYNGEVSLTGNSKESVLIDNFVIKEVGNYFISFISTTPYKGNSIYLKSISKSYNRIVGTVTNTDGITKGLIDINQNDLDVILSTSDARFEIYRSNGDVVLPTNVMLNKGNYYIPYVAPKVDKKTILFKDTDNTWKPVTYLNEWDILDTTKNITTLGSYKFTVKGTEDWKLASSGATITRFQLVVSEMQGNRNPLICDKLPLKTNYDDMTKEGCFTSVSGNTLYVDILSSKANTVELFKTYLINNNISFVAKATTIKQYEINPIFPSSYENETMILFNTGVIPCKNEFYIDSNLGSLQIETNERLSRIEDYMYQSNVAILRGDFRTLAQIYYPNDFIKKEDLPNE